MTKIAHEIPSEATKATSAVIKIQAADMSAMSVVMRPIPKHPKMKLRSACIPSTALSIDPSLPRKAFPEPHTDTKVVEAVHNRLAQMEMVTKR